MGALGGLIINTIRDIPFDTSYALAPVVATALSPLIQPFYLNSETFYVDGEKEKKKNESASIREVAGFIMGIALTVGLNTAICHKFYPSMIEGEAIIKGIIVPAITSYWVNSVAHSFIEQNSQAENPSATPAI